MREATCAGTSTSKIPTSSETSGLIIYSVLTGNPPVSRALVRRARLNYKFQRILLAKLLLTHAYLAEFCILVVLICERSALDHRQDTYISETVIHTSQRYFKYSKLYINAINTSLQMMH
jgi:hypothetical protein